MRLSRHSWSFWKKSRTKLREYQIDAHLPVTVPRMHEQAIRSFVQAHRYGSIKKRQQAAIMLLYLDTALTGKAICSITLSEVTDAGHIEAVHLSQAAIDTLGRWKALRHRLHSNEAERRRQRCPDQWAVSPYLFPAPGGGPTRFASVKSAVTAFVALSSE